MSSSEHAYPSTAISVTHPARMRTWASLHGVGAWTGESFRALELGCGNGTNLLALADRFPDSSFVGVERDAALLEAARTTATRAGLANVTFVEAELAAYEPEGLFDYVIAHGLYSWLPPGDRDRLLAIASRALEPLGVAYVSYNTFPGWAVRGVVREMMADAARGERSDAGKLRAAKARVAEIQRHLADSDHPYTSLLASELSFIQEKHDGYLLSEHLSDDNAPSYFKDVARHAARHGLHFVCEMLPATPDGAVESELPAKLARSGMSRVDAEQMLDVLTYRQFRASLFCREGVSVTSEPNFAALADRGAFAGALVPTAEEPLLGPGKLLGFRAPTGAEIQVQRPLLKAALLALSQAWPAGLTAREAITHAIAGLKERGLLGAAAIDEDEVQRTVGDLVELCRRRQIELLPWTPELARGVPSEPMVRSLARVEAERSPIVTTPRHEPALLPEPERTVARLLDGRRDLRAVVSELSSRLDAGELALDLGAGGDRTVALAELVVKAVAHLRDLGLLADRGGDRAKELA